MNKDSYLLWLDWVPESPVNTTSTFWSCPRTLATGCNLWTRAASIHWKLHGTKLSYSFRQAQCFAIYQRRTSWTLCAPCGQRAYPRIMWYLGSLALVSIRWTVTSFQSSPSTVTNWKHTIPSTWAPHPPLVWAIHSPLRAPAALRPWHVLFLRRYSLNLREAYMR